MISVALCTYNGECFLAAQLATVAAQSTKPAELVICDDASTDATRELIDEFRRSAPFPVKTLFSSVNLGSTKSFERAAEACESEVIAFCDQDDVWETNKLQVLLAALQSTPDAAFAFSDTKLMDEGGRELRGSGWQRMEFDWRDFNSGTASDQFSRLTRRIVVTGTAMAIRSSILHLARPFAENWLHDAWLALIATGTGRRGIAVPEQLVKYRQHSAQQIGVGRFTLNVSDAIRWLKGETMNRRILAERAARQSRAYAELSCRLQELASRGENVDADLFELLRAGSLHEAQRSAIFLVPPAERLRLIAGEWRSGRYSAFSDPWVRPIKDLLL